MFLRKHGLFIMVMLVALWGLNFDVCSETDAEITVDPFIAKAEKLISTERYYEAILALEPLLMRDEKSEAQEEALWLAHQLGEKVAEKISNEYSAMQRMSEPEDLERKRWDRVAFRAATKSVKQINSLGAEIFYSEPGDWFFYYDGFLQRLIDRYPETPKRGIAEYYLIFDGLNIPRQENLSLTLKTLHAYIEKYEKTGRAEVYKTYLDIAHIHHGLWAALTFPDDPGCAMMSWLDPKDDTKSAEAHKAEAEKYYLKYHLNPHGLPEPEDKGYERLKNKEAFGLEYIIYGC